MSWCIQIRWDFDSTNTEFIFCYRFCVGDRFYLCENKILCEYDYEERMVFANMAYNPPNIAQLKRHTSHIPVSPNRVSTSNNGCIVVIVLVLIRKFLS